MKRVKCTQQKDWDVIHLRRDLTQHDFLQMREFVAERFFSQGRNRIVMDCEAMAQLPSIAFGLMCSLSRDATRAGGDFAVIHLSDSVKEIARRIHIDQQVKIFGTLAEAVEALK